MKKNKSDKRQSFKDDMKTIKNEDIRNLQKTFSQFFGSKPDEMQKRASKLRNKVYFFGFLISFFVAVVFLLTQKIKFIGF